MRGLLVSCFALAAGAAAGLAAVFLDGDQAFACSRVPLVAAYIPDAVGQSKVVAIGTITGHSEHAATFRVDERLMGAAEGDTFEIDNRTTHTSSACSPYDEPFNEGFRFRTGERVIMMLEKEVDGLWQVSFGSWAAWQLPDDDLKPMAWDGSGHSPGFGLLANLRTEIAKEAPLLNSDPGFESRTPCNPSSELRPRMQTSTVVVIADVDRGSEFQRATVLEVLAGQAPPNVITVNFRTYRNYDNCDLELWEPMPSVEHTRSGRFVLFLRPDETGVAEYRPALWGSAVEQVNERYVTHGFPTLREIRTTVATLTSGLAPIPDVSQSAAPGAQATRPAVTSGSIPSSADRNPWPYVGLGVGAMGIVVALLGLRLLKSRSAS
jgi:hypothetical protein